MLIKEEHFRNLYKKHVIIKDTELARSSAQLFQIDSIMEDDLDGEELKQRLESLEVPDEINAVFVIPYIDHTAGMSFSLAALAHTEGDNVEIYKREDFSIDSTFRKDRVNDLEFEYLENMNINDDFDIKYYNEFIDRLKVYDVNPAVETLRFIDILDGERNEDFPDDLGVIFIKEGLQMEKMWVRCEDLTDENKIKATLLNTSFQEFGVEAGDEVIVFPYKIEDSDEWVVICDLNKK